MSVETFLVPAAVAALITLLGYFLLEPIKHYLNIRFLRRKLDYEYQNEQIRSVRSNTGHFLGPLILSAEELNYRIWNINVDYDRNWLSLKSDGSMG